MSFHFFVRFDPPTGKESEFREEALRVVEATRAEAGCISNRLFVTVREPIVFSIYSEWVDEAAFDLHAQLPHTVRFITRTEELFGKPVQGLRTRQIGGGMGAAAAPGK